MLGQKKRQILGLVLVFIFLAIFMIPQLQGYYYLQEKQRLSVGEPLEILFKFPPTIHKAINIYISAGQKLLAMEGQDFKEGKYILGDNSPIVVKPGQVSLELKLFGLIPLKKINVDVVPDLRLMPGGHSIGVLLRTEGVMVVGHSPILNQQNEPCFPARDADIKVGDVIISINGIKVLTDEQLRNLVENVCQTDQKILLTIKREEQLLRKIIYPQYCYETKSYRIGLFVRDNAGGVGTLTFWDPLTKKYGALGHVITDSETNQKLHIRQGKILSAHIENIQKGRIGSPGEKIGMFLKDTECGNIEKNEQCGIYGTLHKELTNSQYNYSLPVLYANQVHSGKAEILTVVQGQEIKKYEIIIEKILYGRTDGKNMVIRINDHDLLKETGGIVQGMSGSPIIQDGRLIGAITHVFVNDPSRGYGVFIENMLLEAGLINKQKQILGFSSQDFVS
ncbi:MAG: SpoIVB peptidase [Clostridia bacterium]|nr:SpoIVB peptidase [Clostridia bacterium]MDD4664935.1 SpoIVB peptidase [Clostridia bacterium]